MRAGRLVSLAVGATVALGCSSEQTATATDSVRDRAAADHRWDAASIEISTLDELDRGGCHFYRVGNPTILDSWTYAYARLPSGELAGPASPETAATLIRACAGVAGPDWLAHIVTEFSGEVPGIVVDDDSSGSAPRLIADAGFEYFAPRTTDGTVTYFVRNFDAGSIHLVEATLPDEGDLAVSVHQVVAPR